MKTLDPVDTYFECISHCHLLNEEEETCLTVCVEKLKSADIPAED